MPLRGADIELKQGLEVSFRSADVITPPVFVFHIPCTQSALILKSSH